MHEALLEIARSGVRGPSADNRHIFLFEFQDTCICLWATQEFAATTAPHRRVLGLISLGAVVENMRLRATELGLFTDAVWSLGIAGSAPLVRLNFQSTSNTHPDPLAAAIPTRCTNRRMYRGPSLTPDETESLAAAVSTVKGVQFVLLSGQSRKLALSLIWRAESERFLRQELHKEIFSSIRFDLSWRETAELALPPGALEIEPPMRPIFKALRHWPLMRQLTWIGAHHMVGLRAGLLPAWQAPALCILSTSLPMDQGAVAVGAALERVWLRATLLNLAMQPLAASAVLPLQSTADRGASDAVRRKLSEGWKAIVPGASPLMVFRLGRAARPTITSSRPPLANYILPALR